MHTSHKNRQQVNWCRRPVTDADLDKYSSFLKVFRYDDAAKLMRRLSGGAELAARAEELGGMSRELVIVRHKNEPVRLRRDFKVGVAVMGSAGLADAMAINVGFFHNASGTVVGLASTITVIKAAQKVLGWLDYRYAEIKRS